MQKNKGFTLIELLVTITILGVLAAIGLTSYATATQKARNSRRAADIQQIRSALEMYRTDNGAYPDGLPDLKKPRDYIPGPAVKDPKDTSPYTYEYTPDATRATYELTYNLETDAGPSLVTYTNP